MISSGKRPEILAPCGSYEILVAAVKAGADACYIGGNRFSARAFAENLADDEIIKAIDFAHKYRTKLYLTLNTLIKNDEVEEVYATLLPYYEAGVDAVIVQDTGVFSVVRALFPKLAVHCSTQMNITSVYGARFMRERGAARIVTAREMPLSEIRRLKDEVDIEVEAFVHGAMCYSYSGQCLMSSLAGGRSGNRGRCAQPCRKCYDGSYLLSMKDMCTLSILPKLVAAGIDSLKIEGRMKNEYYVASAVDAYRRMTDDVVNGCFDEAKAIEYQKRLADIYNRGGFSNGYFFEHNGADMISIDRPNNQGTMVGTVNSKADGRVHIKLAEKIYKGDVLEIGLSDGTAVEITSAEDYPAGSVAELAAPKTRLIQANKAVYRTKCNALLKQISETILEKNITRRINGCFEAKLGAPMTLTLWTDEEYPVRVCVSGNETEPSQKPQTDYPAVCAKLMQFGNTGYALGDLRTEIDENVFLPVSCVKALRRMAVSALDEAICNGYRRVVSKEAVSAAKARIKEGMMPDTNPSVDSPSDDSLLQNISYAACVTDIGQLRAVLETDTIKDIYLDAMLYKKASDMRMFDANKEKKDIYITLPHIIDSRFDLCGYLPKTDIRGIYIRNIDGFAAVLFAYDSLPKNLRFIAAPSLYAYNDFAADFWRKHIPSLVYEMPYELNEKELVGLSTKPELCLVYGHQQVMLSAQCVQKTKRGCDRADAVVPLSDDRGNRFYAKCMCSQCCNVIYNGRAYNMLDKRKRLSEATQAKCLLFSFTVEDEKKTREILRTAEDGNAAYSDGSRANTYTNGHFFRGVE